MISASKKTILTKRFIVCAILLLGAILLFFRINGELEKNKKIFHIDQMINDSYSNVSTKHYKEAAASLTKAASIWQQETFGSGDFESHLKEFSKMKNDQTADLVYLFHMVKNDNKKISNILHPSSKVNYQTATLLVDFLAESSPSTLNGINEIVNDYLDVTKKTRDSKIENIKKSHDNFNKNRGFQFIDGIVDTIAEQKIEVDAGLGNGKKLEKPSFIYFFRVNGDESSVVAIITDDMRQLFSNMIQMADTQTQRNQLIQDHMTYMQSLPTYATRSFPVISEDAGYAPSYLDAEPGTLITGRGSKYKLYRFCTSSCQNEGVDSLNKDISTIEEWYTEEIKTATLLSAYVNQVKNLRIESKNMNEDGNAITHKKIIIPRKNALSWIKSGVENIPEDEQATFPTRSEVGNIISKTQTLLKDDNNVALYAQTLNSGKKYIVVVENKDSWPENTITSYAIIKDGDNVVNFIETPISESGDSLIQFLSYYSMSGKLIARESEYSTYSMCDDTLTIKHKKTEYFTSTGSVNNYELSSVVVKGDKIIQNYKCDMDSTAKDTFESIIQKDLIIAKDLSELSDKLYLLNFEG